MLSTTFDPANRLVADALEADWNAKLRALAEAQEEYQRRRPQDRLVVDDTERGASLLSQQTFRQFGTIPIRHSASASACSVSSSRMSL